MKSRLSRRDRRAGPGRAALPPNRIERRHRAVSPEGLTSKYRKTPSLAALILVCTRLLAQSSSETPQATQPTPTAVDASRNRALDELTRPPLALSEATGECSSYGPPIGELVVGKSGLVQSAHVLRPSGCKKADKRILAWTKKWTLAPAIKDGHPISSKIKVTINID